MQPHPGRKHIVDVLFTQFCLHERLPRDWQQASP